MLTPNELRLFARRPHEAASLPAGVYFLFDGDTLVYVGQSERVASRLYEHRQRGRTFDSFAFLAEADRFERATVEQNYVFKYRPRYNKRVPRIEPATSEYRAYARAEYLKRKFL